MSNQTATSRRGDRYYCWQGADLLLFCHVQPGASGDGIAGPYGDRLRLRIAAAASDGKANQRLVGFVADTFGVSPGDVALLSGASSRRKTLRIHAPRRLPEALGIEARQ